MDSGAIAYIRQHKALGLGHAVWCARRLIGNEPFAVILPDDVIAAESARVASPFLAIGKPSTIVADAELAPGLPNSTPAKESPVVEDATTATQKIKPR